MTRKNYDIVVIGGGITGLGITRKIAEQGLKVILIEKDDLASGTSGNFHGVFHSGARYAVIDPSGAKECHEQNLSMRNNPIFKDAIDPTGGLFIVVDDKDLEYSDKFYSACKNIGIPIEEIKTNDALSQEPLLTKNLKRAFSLPTDGYIKDGQIININKTIAENHGAEILTGHAVSGFNKTSDSIESIKIQDKNGQESEITCNFVINAAGVWAGLVAKLAGAQFHLIPDRGAMIVFEERLSNKLLNHCRMPNNGDMLLPAGTNSILGTTATKTDDIESHSVSQEEIDCLIKEGEKMIPGIGQFAIARTYAGVRALYAPDQKDANSRGLSRSFEVINHKDKDRIKNFISVVGGKFMYYELMADQAIKTMQQNNDTA